MQFPGERETGEGGNFSDGFTAFPGTGRGRGGRGEGVEVTVTYLKRLQIPIWNDLKSPGKPPRKIGSRAPSTVTVMRVRAATGKIRGSRREPATGFPVVSVPPRRVALYPTPASPLSRSRAFSHLPFPTIRSGRNSAGRDRTSGKIKFEEFPNFPFFFMSFPGFYSSPGPKSSSPGLSSHFGRRFHFLSRNIKNLFLRTIFRRF